MYVKAFVLYIYIFKYLMLLQDISNPFVVLYFNLFTLFLVIKISKFLIYLISDFVSDHFVKKSFFAILAFQ